MSLRARLILLVTMVLLGALALGAALAYWHAVSKVETEMKAALAAGARLAAIAADDTPMMAAPRQRLEMLVARFDGDRHVRAALVGPDGKPLKVSRLAPPADPAPQILYRLLGKGAVQAQVLLPSTYSGEGSVTISADPLNEVSEAWNDLKLYVAIMTLFTGLVLALLYAVIGRALRPLHDLTHALARVGEGDLSPRVALAGSREIEALGAGFNHMVGRLGEAESRSRRLGEQLERVAEEERVELARNLHDEVSPLLFSVDVDATTIRHLADTADDAGRKRVAERADAIKDAVASLKRNVKGILSDLRPADPRGMPLRPAVEALFEFWRSRHPDVTFSLSMTATAWGDRIDSALHSIIRESVGNALKHGRPSAIAVVVEDRSGVVEVRIENDGAPLRGDATRRDALPGYGILGMKERVAQLGGELTARDRDAGGVAIVARLPRSPANGLSDARTETRS